MVLIFGRSDAWIIYRGIENVGVVGRVDEKRGGNY